MYPQQKTHTEFLEELRIKNKHYLNGDNVLQK